MRRDAVSVALTATAGCLVAILFGSCVVFAENPKDLDRISATTSPIDSLPTQTLPAPVALPSELSASKPVKISVPNYDKKFQEMLAQERAIMEQNRPKPQKPLWISVSSEIQHYGVILSIIAVLLIVLLTLMRDIFSWRKAKKAREAAWESDKEEKKDIWEYPRA